MVSRGNAQVIADRRRFHQYPELGNREFNTARIVALRLKALGLEVQTGVAKTGVVAVLRGARPGPVVALRAELDALPVTEDVDLPFRSTVRSEYEGKQVGVMHACGHDAHIAILLGVAQVLSQLRPDIAGTVKFIFQPAEEGPPAGESGGAKLMIAEGVLDHDPQPKAIFALHVMSGFDTQTIGYRTGGIMASSDDFRIVVHGKQTHAALPWKGVDPIVTAAEIILGLQTIPSRQMDTTRAPVIVTVSQINGGVRSNIISDSVTLVGTVRALEPDMREDALLRIARMSERIADSEGATATTTVDPAFNYAVTYNDPTLTARMLPTLKRVAGASHVVEVAPVTGGEDFSAYQQKIPGLFFFLGARTPGAPVESFPENHSPQFHIDESVLSLGVRSLTNLVLDYFSGAVEE